MELYTVREPTEALAARLAAAAVLARLNTQMIGYQFVSVANAINFENAHREHGEVLAAIFARDPDAAEQAMRHHLRGTRDSIVRAATCPRRH